MTADTISEQTEFDRIVLWRTEELIRAGYEPSDAMVMADHLEIDLHFAVELLSRGCPVDLAIRILI